jgi:hypothetical protein
MHTFAGTATTFFVPALATCLRLFAGKKLLSQCLHAVGILYVLEISSEQAEFFACVIDQLIVGQTAWSYCADGTGFETDPGQYTKLIVWYIHLAILLIFVPIVHDT